MNAETVLEAQTVALLRRLAREQEMRTRRARDEGYTFRLPDIDAALAEALA